MTFIKILFLIILLLIIYYITNYDIIQNFQNISKNDNNIIQNDNLTSDDLFDYQYKAIYNNFKKDILKLNKPIFDDVQVLHDNNYLNNYYYDMFGNQIQATLNDYFVNYYSTINNKKLNEYKKVNSIKKDNNFIIPDQYDTHKHMTNAYHIDYSKIIDPRTAF